MMLCLGGGKRFLKGYVHVDLADYPHIDYQHDVKELPMFKDNQVSIIYASHVLEYFDRAQIADVLMEWFRVLEPKGVLRLAVPDFEALISVYNKCNNLDLILGPLYGRWQIQGTHTIVYHKTVYDYLALKRVLEGVGFRNVRSWDWRKVFVGEHDGYDDFSQAYYPHMDKENGILISLNVEADKP
jgi:predicted SAM-dependent methyltransferase